jgi:cold shock protein
MATGIIRWFNAVKGYGFITGVDGAEIYFHSTAVSDRAGMANLGTGTRVEFDLIQTKLGFEATNVRCSA